ncbi:MAG TPA: ABC transporter permease [Lacipirellulaceae bacterium]
MNLAVKDIQHSLGRFLLTTVGVGLLLMVVMGMRGVLRGSEEDATFIVDNVGADLWVVQGETRGPFAELSKIPANLRDRVATVPGVKSARQCVFLTIQRQHLERDLRMNVFGLDWPTDKGEWLPITAGRPLGHNHFEMVADRLTGLALEERVRLGKDVYTVVGITSGMVTQAGDGLGFFTVSDAKAIQADVPGEAVRLERAARPARARANDIGRTQPQILERAAGLASEIPALGPAPISAVMVQTESQADAAEVASVISSWRDVAVLSREDQRQLILTGVVARQQRQIGMITTLLIFAAAIVLALIVYTLTLDRIAAIALMKLIGAPNRVVLGMVLQQAFLIGAAGYGMGFLLGQLILPYFPRRVLLQEADLVQLAVIVAAMCLVGSVLGIWRAARVSPNEVLS